VHDAFIVQERHVANARHIRNCGATADVEKNTRRLQFTVANAYSLRPNELRMAFNHGDVARAIQPGANSSARLLDDRILTRLDPHHVNAHRRIDQHAVLASMARDKCRPRAGDERLRRDATIVDAGATETVALNDRSLQAFFAAAHGECRSGLSGADDNRIKYFGHGVTSCA
jgi:hypothetical protein